MHAGTGAIPRCDVYVYASDDELLCSNCWLESLAQTGRHHFSAASTQDMIDHLNQHRAVGHAVPWFDETVAELWADDAENFPRSER